MKSIKILPKTHLLKCVFLQCVAFLFFSLNGFAQVCSPAPVGLVSWWQGENNALDARSLNNGTLQNGATFAAGNVGQGFQFTNTQHVEVPDSASLDLTNAITLETWVSPQQLGSAGNNTILLFKGNIGVLTQQSYGMFYNNDGTVTFRVCDGSTCLNAGTGVVLPLNTFSHIVGTYDGTTVKFYVNGVLTNFFPFSLGTIFNSTNPLIIGSNAGTFVGKMDEVSIYNRAITQGEVTSIFNAGTAGKCVPIPTPAPVGLVSWWQGENNALDSRSRNNGTLQNGATFSAGNVGQAFEFDGTNDFVSAPDSTSLRPTNLTVEGWIRLDDLSRNQVFFSKAVGGVVNHSFVAFFSNAGGGVTPIGFATGNAGGLNPIVGGTFQPVIGQWNHYTFTFDDATKTQSIFVNGVLNASNTATLSIGYDANVFNLGAANNTGPTADFLDGGIDELSVYNRVLTAIEIQAIANAGTAGKCKPTATVSPSGQVGWWSGDGNANDLAGANNGTLQNGAIHIIGKVGQGFSFNGADAVVATPNSTLNNPFPTISIEGWVNPTTHGTDGTGTFGKTIVSNTNGDGFALRLLNGVIQSDLRLTGGDARTTFGTALPLNAWSHVALTYDGTNVRAFLNGVQVGSNFPASGTVKNTANSGICLFIGGDPSPACTADTGFGFNGEIDELSIYNRAITPDEITSIFNAGIAGKLKQNATINTSSSVSIWQGEGNANDTRGANNGTFTANTYAAGKVGQAFSLNGNTDSVDMGLVQSTQVFSLEAWVRPLSAVNDSINQELILGDGVTSIVVRKIGGVDRPVFQYRDSTLSAFEQVIGTTAIPLNIFTHLAGTYDGVTLRLYVNGVLNNQSTPANAMVADCESNYHIGGFPAGTLCGIGNPPFQFFNGVVDEAARYNRALSPTEVRANYEAGNALSTVVGDARITFPTVSAAGITQQIPLDLSTLPSLPLGSTTTGLTYDIATTATFTGSPQVCFNLPSITDSTIFNNLRIAHLESNIWVNRTDLASINFATKTVCTSGLTSLSPFAVVNGFAPSAANASISGRVVTNGGNGIRNAVIQLTSATGETKYVRTSSFGYYKFEDLEVGQTYILTVSAKRYTFANPTRVITLNEDLTDEDFVSDGK